MAIAMRPNQLLGQGICQIVHIQDVWHEVTKYLSCMTTTCFVTRDLWLHEETACAWHVCDVSPSAKGRCMMPLLGFTGNHCGTVLHCQVNATSTLPAPYIINPFPVMPCHAIAHRTNCSVC